jgi:hypothetical protein
MIATIPNLILNATIDRFVQWVGEDCWLQPLTNNPSLVCIVTYKFWINALPLAIYETSHEVSGIDPNEVMRLGQDLARKRLVAHAIFTIMEIFDITIIVSFYLSHGICLLVKLWTFNAP